MVDVRDTEAMRRSFRTRGYFSGLIPRVCTLGWYAMTPQGMGSDTWLAGPVSGTRWAHGIETVVLYALNGHRIPAQGIALGTAS